MPQYIIGKLGLNRDPLAELQNDLSNLDNLAEAPCCDEGPVQVTKQFYIYSRDINTKMSKIQKHSKSVHFIMLILNSHTTAFDNLDTKHVR